MNSTLHRIAAAASLLAAVALASATPRAQDPRDLRIRTEPVRDHVHVLSGQGGNIGLSIGDDGTFMVDSQFAPLTGRILEAVRKLTDKPVRFVVNTHWHFDHVGGNENLAKAGTVVIAHENVRRLMRSAQVMQPFQRAVPAAPKPALPAITFAEAIDFHCNGDRLHVFHVAPAHTDGDAVVHFEKANVFHLGDIYFSNGYPFIDVQNGGHIDGMVAACDQVIALANAESRIIPGHGPVTGVRELQDYRNMLAQVSDHVHKLIDAGKTRDAVVAARPTAAFDEKWGQAFMQPDVWVGIVHDGIVSERKRRAEPAGPRQPEKQPQAGAEARGR